jgi:hypothetical protein
MPRAVSPAESRSSPDRPLAGVRPVKGHRGAGESRRPSAGEVGEPATVRLGFGGHGLGNPDNLCLNPTPIRECALRRVPDSVALRL